MADGLVYVGADNGNVYLLSAASGAKAGSFTGGTAIDSSPAVANGVVYVGTIDGDVAAFGLAADTSTVARPAIRNLHPDYSLRRPRA